MMYVINAHHRNGNSSKSQWSISQDEEILSFNYSEKNGWILDERGWGLHFDGGQVCWLGVAQDHTTPVFIAKFVGSNGTTWHGYPADYRKNNHDIPESEVLHKWLTSSVLSAPKIRKIARGQPCNL